MDKKSSKLQKDLFYEINAYSSPYLFINIFAKKSKNASYSKIIKVCDEKFGFESLDKAWENSKKKGKWHNPDIIKTSYFFLFEGIFPKRIHIETFSMKTFKNGEETGERMRFVSSNDDLILRFKYMGLTKDLEKNLNNFKENLCLSLKNNILSNFEIEFGLSYKSIIKEL